jgi:glucose-6-phosphate isomerase
MPGFEINHTDTSQVADQKLGAHIQSLSGYRSTLQAVIDQSEYNEPESCLNLPTDEEALQSVVRTVNEITAKTNPQYVVVIGMGGSIRGTKAVYDLVANQAGSEILFLNSVDDKSIATMVDKLQACSRPDDFAICVVSKSGTTAETIANTNVLLQKLTNTFERSEVYERMIAVTDPGSELDELGDEQGIKQVYIPEHVGGRFSVLSAVGLVPLLLAGLDVRDLIGGAESMRAAIFSGRSQSDPAAALAAILYEHAQSARRIINHFFFTPQALHLGRWSAQLFAESLGKRENRQGEPTFSGMYPTTSIGPDDLHSLFQLQLGGPKSFVSIFIRERNNKQGDLSHQINDEFIVEKLAHLTGRSLGDVRSAFGQAVTDSFAEADRPFIDITVPQLNLERIGQFLLLEQAVVMYLGELMNVNAFNQPQVETYKDKTRDILADNN